MLQEDHLENHQKQNRLNRFNNALNLKRQQNPTNTGEKKLVLKKINEMIV